jgi:glycosyltransferase involved in cell wall biosynthesis
MRVAVDGRLLDAPRAGSAYYTLGLLRGLAAAAGSHEVLLLAQGAADQARGLSQVTPVTLPEARLADPPWEQLRLPTELRGLGCDVLFSPTSVIPLLACCPRVVVVYDLGFLHYPEFYHPRLRQYLREWVPRSAQAAEAVICLSEFVARDAVATWGLAADRVHVVPGAAAARFAPPHAGADPDRVCQRYRLRRPFVLSVASLERNKNLPRLLQAFAQARPRQGEPWQLVLVGRPGGGTAELQVTIARLGLQEQVVLTGFVPDADLPALYGAAAVFAFVSLCEGFGLPPLEAMACGTPVLTANVDSLPVVAGAAAVLVDPQEVTDIARGLAELMNDPQRRRALGEAGRQRAQAFSWERSTRQLVTVLGRVAAGPRTHSPSSCPQVLTP